MKLNNKGMSLVEIAVGFVLLVICIASFEKIINLSTEMTSTSIDSKNKRNVFKERYFDGDASKFHVETASQKIEGADDKIDIVIELKELSGAPGKDGDGKLLLNYIPSTSILLDNVKIKKIENFNDNTMSKTAFIAKYIYTKPNE